MYEISKCLLEHVEKGENLVLVTSIKENCNKIKEGLERKLYCCSNLDGNIKEIELKLEQDSEIGLEKGLKRSFDKEVDCTLKALDSKLDKALDREIVTNSDEDITKDSDHNVMIASNQNIDKGILDRLDGYNTIASTSIENLVNTLKEGMPKIIQNNENGENLLLEPFYPKERLIILGGGHIALPLAEFGAKTGFSVVVCDDRPSFANKARFPLAEKVICESFDKVFDKLNITSNDYLIIITRGHRHDTECLRQILIRKETIYLGMIGSRRRTAIVKEQLVEEGYDKDRISRICTPIGLSIGAVTPEEISISILAEVIRRKRLEKSEEYMVGRSDLDFTVIETITRNNHIPSSVVTVISTKGSTPRGTGAKMIVYRDGRIEGSIGGGCSEAAVIREAIDIIGTKQYLRKTIDMTGDAAEEEGMVCGGIMEVLIEDVIT